MVGLSELAATSLNNFCITFCILVYLYTLSPSLCLSRSLSYFGLIVNRTNLNVSDANTTDMVGPPSKWIDIKKLVK